MCKVTKTLIEKHCYMQVTGMGLKPASTQKCNVKVQVKMFGLFVRTIAVPHKCLDLENSVALMDSRYVIPSSL